MNARTGNVRDLARATVRNNRQPMERRAYRQRNARPDSARMEFAARALVTTRVWLVQRRKKGKASMVHAVPSSPEPIPTMNASMETAMALELVKRRRICPMVRRARLRRNAHRAIASTLCVAITRARARVKRARPQRRVKAAMAFVA